MSADHSSDEESSLSAPVYEEDELGPRALARRVSETRTKVKKARRQWIDAIDELGRAYLLHTTFSDYEREKQYVKAHAEAQQQERDGRAHLEKLVDELSTYQDKQRRYNVAFESLRQVRDYCPPELPPHLQFVSKKELEVVQSRAHELRELQTRALAEVRKRMDEEKEQKASLHRQMEEVTKKKEEEVKNREDEVERRLKVVEQKRAEEEEARKSFWDDVKKKKDEEETAIKRLEEESKALAENSKREGERIANKNLERLLIQNIDASSEQVNTLLNEVRAIHDKQIESIKSSHNAALTVERNKTTRLRREVSEANAGAQDSQRRAEEVIATLRSQLNEAYDAHTAANNRATTAEVELRDFKQKAEEEKVKMRDDQRRERGTYTELLSRSQENLTAAEVRGSKLEDDIVELRGEIGVLNKTLDERDTHRE